MSITNEKLIQVIILFMGISGTCLTATT